MCAYGVRARTSLVVIVVATTRAYVPSKGPSPDDRALHESGSRPTRPPFSSTALPTLPPRRSRSRRCPRRGTTVGGTRKLTPYRPSNLPAARGQSSAAVDNDDDA